jgi:hypothetical protein
MKTEFVALTPAGAFALLFAGFLIGEAYARWDAIYLLLAILLLLIAQNDARVGYRGSAGRSGNGSGQTHEHWIRNRHRWNVDRRRHHGMG